MANRCRHSIAVQGPNTKAQTAAPDDEDDIKKFFGQVDDKDAVTESHEPVRHPIWLMDAKSFRTAMKNPVWLRRVTGNPSEMVTDASDAEIEEMARSVASLAQNDDVDIIQKHWTPEYVQYTLKVDGVSGRTGGKEWWKPVCVSRHVAEKVRRRLVVLMGRHFFSLDYGEEFEGCIWYPVYFWTPDYVQWVYEANGLSITPEEATQELQHMRDCLYIQRKYEGQRPYGMSEEAFALEVVEDECWEELVMTYPEML